VNPRLRRIVDDKTPSWKKIGKQLVTREFQTEHRCLIVALRFKIYNGFIKNHQLIKITLHNLKP